MATSTFSRNQVIRGVELLALIALAVLGLVLGQSAYAVGLLTLLVIYGISLIGLDATVGYLGQVNLAHAGFMGLGGYAAGLMVAHFGVGLLPALCVSILIGLVLGGLLAVPALRLEGPQFALATLSFGTFAVLCLNELESITNGAQGLSLVRPALLGKGTLDAQTFYWVCLALLAFVWLGARRLMEGRWGRAIAALKDSPIATDAMGIGTLRHKVLAFAFGSALGAFAGGLYAFNLGFLQPQAFGYELSVTLLLGSVLGGRKTVWGALVGAGLVVLLPNLLSNRSVFLAFAGIGAVLAIGRALLAMRRRELAFPTIAPALAMALLLGIALKTPDLESWRKGLFALILFAVVVGLPDGLMGFVSQALARLVRLPLPPLPTAAPLDAVLPNRSAGGRPVLDVSGLKLYFGGVRAIDGVSLQVAPGEVLGLIGPNGSGKSSLVNVVTGLYTPTEGGVTLDGQRIESKGLLAASRHGVSRTFQNLQIFGDLSALDNVSVSLRGAYRLIWPLVAAGFGDAEERAAQSHALALLELVGLTDKARIRARDLTYSDQRFMEIARALASKPVLLVLDEPAAGMSKPDVAKLKTVIARIKARGISIILIEHHLDVVAELTDRVVVLDGGKEIAQGVAEDVRRNPQVIEAYLGSAAHTEASA
ncbi:MAG: branched-chain amino acid ABC transporter ATP-binding protein/permease [Burkholderiales bacterium]|nr:branched-chain amino acid ABC transporter ATP-binding protein/permease [Burkholderiales bacterium]